MGKIQIYYVPAGQVDGTRTDYNVGQPYKRLIVAYGDSGQPYWPNRGIGELNPITGDVRFNVPQTDSLYPPVIQFEDTSPDAVSGALEGTVGDPSVVGDFILTAGEYFPMFLKPRYTDRTPIDLSAQRIVWTARRYPDDDTPAIMKSSDAGGGIQIFASSSDPEDHYAIAQINPDDSIGLILSHNQRQFMHDAWTMPTTNYAQRRPFIRNAKMLVLPSVSKF